MTHAPANPATIQPPPRSLRGFLQQMGPGLILVAAIIGTGELVNTTGLGAQVGYSLLWLILVSCAVKVIVQIELGRHAIVHGEPTLTALHTIPGPRWRTSWIGWMWLFVMLTTLTSVGAMCGLIGQVILMAAPSSSLRLAEAIAPLAPEVSDFLIDHQEYPGAVLTTLLAGALLILGGFRGLLRVTAVLVTGITILTVVCTIGLALPGSAHPIDGQAVVRGLSFSLPAAAAIPLAFATFGNTGVGAMELFSYPYWCLEKGYAKFTGIADRDVDWVERARGWVRVMQADAWSSMVVFTISTVAFYLLGAAVLHEPGITKDQLPQGPGMIVTLSQLYLSLGSWTQFAFLIGAWAVLFSTIYAATGANSRMTTDFLLQVRFLPDSWKSRQKTIIKVISAIYLVISLGLYMLVREPRWLAIAGGYAQGLLLPSIAGATIYLAIKRRDARVAPGWMTMVLLWIAFVAVAIVAVYSVAMDLLSLLAPWFGGT